MTIVYTHPTGKYRAIEQNGVFIPQKGFILSATPHAPKSVAWESFKVRDSSSPYVRYIPKSFKTLKGAISYINNQ